MIQKQEEVEPWIEEKYWEKAEKIEDVWKELEKYGLSIEDAMKDD